MRAARALVICVAASIAGGALSQSSSATVPGQNGKIAFFDNTFGDQNRTQYDLYLVQPDGSSLRLFDGGGHDPSFSPDGSKIVFLDLDVQDQVKVESTHDQVGPTAPLTSAFFGTPGSPVFDPRGRSIFLDLGSLNEGTTQLNR